MLLATLKPVELVLETLDADALAAVKDLQAWAVQELNFALNDNAITQRNRRLIDWAADAHGITVPLQEASRPTHYIQGFMIREAMHGMDNFCAHHFPNQTIQGCKLSRAGFLMIQSLAFIFDPACDGADFEAFCLPYVKGGIQQCINANSMVLERNLTGDGMRSYLQRLLSVPATLQQPVAQDAHLPHYERQQKEGTKTRKRLWREWIWAEVDPAGDRDDARRKIDDGELGVRMEVQSKQISKNVVANIVERQCTTNTEEVLHAAAEPALIYAIRDFDPTTDEPFEDYAARTIELCLLSLPIIEDNDRLSKPNLVTIAVRMGTMAHRAEKYRLDWATIGKSTVREERFALWCTKQHILGDTHEERLLSAQIRFAPAVILEIARIRPNLRAKELSLFTESMFHCFNGALRHFSPDEPSEDFLCFARSRIKELFQNTHDVSVTAETDSAPLAEAPSTPDTLPANAEADATVIETAIPKTDAPLDVRTPEVPDGVLEEPREYTRKKKRKSDFKPAPEPTAPDENSFSAVTDAAGKNTTQTSEDEGRQAELLEEEQKKERLWKYVKKQVDSDVWDYQGGLDALATAYKEEAPKIAIQVLKQKPNSIKHPGSSAVNRAARELLDEAIETFDPPDSEGDRFRGHLTTLIQANILKKYQQYL